MNNTALTSHLFRRAGFGATAVEVERATTQGFSHTVDTLVAGLGQPDTGADAIPVPALSPAPTDLAALRANPAARRALSEQLSHEDRALVSWWLQRMVASTNPLREKLTFLLHGHFPTAVSKVRYPIYMYGQNQLFRTLGGGDFDALTQAVATDPAMLIWLDAGSDKASDPNENFARELMERFTMGIGTYTEQDVRAAAYCFSGWRLNAHTHGFAINPRQHSTTAQTFLGVPGVTAGQQVIDIVTHSRASARFVPAALWSHVAYPVTTGDRVVSDLAPGYASDHNVANLLRAMFEHPSFTSSQAMSGLIKQPTEYVVGAFRALGVTSTDMITLGPLLASTMPGLGQVIFDPPSVGGWPQNEYWLSSVAALSRWQFAQSVARHADLSAVADVPVGSRVDAAAQVLSIDHWSKPTATALARSAANPQTLVTLALVSPEFVSN